MSLPFSIRVRSIPVAESPPDGNPQLSFGGRCLQASFGLLMRWGGSRRDGAQTQSGLVSSGARPVLAGSDGFPSQRQALASVACNYTREALEWP